MGAGRRLSSSGKAEEEKLKRVSEYYEKQSMLGEHIHHGYFVPGSTVSMSDNPAAQLRMIDEALRFASVSDDPENKPKSILDVGCGTGGTCRYLARKYGAQCKGITIAPVEVERAKALAREQGLQENVSFEVADANLALPFPDGQFDLVWCMESAEHIADKEKLVREFVRVAAPGAKIILTSWCHRDLSSSEQSMKPDEEKLLKRMCDLIFLQPYCSMADYINLFESHPLEDIKAEDWTRYVSPLFPVYSGLAFRVKGFISLLRTRGWIEAVKFVREFKVLTKVHEKGLLKLAVISGGKHK